MKKLLLIIALLPLMAFGQSGGNRQIKQVNSGLAGNGICVVIVDNNGQIQSIAKGVNGEVLSLDANDSLGFFPDIDPVYAADSAMIVFFADTVTKIATKADIQTIISVGAYILNNQSSAQTGNIWIGKTTDTAYKGLVIQNKKTLSTNNENQIVLGNGSTLLGASDRTYYLTNKMTSATAAQFALKYWNGTATFTPFVVNSDQTVTFDSTITISNGILDTHAATVGQMRDSIDEFVSMPVEVSSDNMLVKTVGTSDREIEETGVSILDDNSIVTPGYIQAGKDTTIEGVLRTDCIRDIYGNTIFSYIGQGIRIGDKSGYESGDGQGIFIGANSGYSSDGAENVFIGELSGETNIGNSNVGIGFNSAQSSLGDDNVFIGYYSGYNNSSSSNTGIGEYSLSDNEGVFNTGIGSYSLSGNSGDYNVGAGQGALIGNSGNNVCGIGYLSAADNTGHSVNGIGILSLGSNKSSYSNAFGAYSLRYVKSVSGYLTAIGHNAATGSSSDSINAVNATAIGANSTINASNSINLGDGSVNKLYMANKEVFYQPLQYGTAGTSGQLLVASGINSTPAWAAKSTIALTAFDSTGFRVKPSQITGFYPGAGIPLSTGTGWGTSITNNSANWNEAHEWGNHASAGYLTSQTSHADVVVDGDFTSQGIMLRGASSGTYSILTNNSENWNEAHEWGNHASAGYISASTPANGDILYYNNGWQKLAKGSDGEVLTLASGIPDWGPAAEGGSSLWENDAEYTDFIKTKSSKSIKVSSSIPSFWMTNATTDFFIDIRSGLTSINSVASGIGSGINIESGSSGKVGITKNNILVYEFPSDNGDPNQVLQTDGSGTLSWAPVSTGGGDMLKSTYDKNSNNVVDSVDVVAITGKVALTNIALATNDELLVADINENKLKKLTVSNLTSYMQDHLDFGDGEGIGTNLGKSVYSDSIVITSSTGNDVRIESSTTTMAGLMSSTDNIRFRRMNFTPNYIEVNNIMSLALGCNFIKSVSSNTTLTFKNFIAGQSGQIEIRYSGSSVITFAASGMTINIADNIYDSAGKVLEKSSGVAIYSYYITNDNNIYINGTQTYY